MFFQQQPRLFFPIPHVPPAGSRAMLTARPGMVAGTYQFRNSKRDCAKAEGLILLCPPKQGCLERLSFTPHTGCISLYKTKSEQAGKGAVRDGNVVHLLHIHIYISLNPLYLANALLGEECTG